MKTTLATLALLGTSLAASAGCVGGSALQNCTDDFGNSYNVQRHGNTTNVQGFNPATGNTWSQSTHRNGNVTQTYGNAANGAAWNSTTVTNPGMVQQFGTDSQGRSFFRTCTQTGCF